MWPSPCFSPDFCHIQWVFRWLDQRAAELVTVMRVRPLSRGPGSKDSGSDQTSSATFSEAVVCDPLLWQVSQNVLPSANDLELMCTAAVCTPSLEALRELPSQLRVIITN